MAASPFTTAHYTGEQFVESSGVILFDFSQEMPKEGETAMNHGGTLLYEKSRNRQDTNATSILWQCRLVPRKREKISKTPDQAGTYLDLTEPFMPPTREICGKSNVKLIWWYIAEIDETAQKTAGEADFTSGFFDSDETMKQLTFQGGRDVLA